VVPRDALEAWRTKLAVLTGLIEPEEDPEEAKRGLTIDQPIQKYLVEEEATKSRNAFRQYTVVHEAQRRCVSKN